MIQVQGKELESDIMNVNQQDTSLTHQTDDNAKKLQFKNLIKEKVLKPSKLPKYQPYRGHHSHLVIRDSHYLIKLPTSFITCASCHRGRVLKIQAIKEQPTEAILEEIYSSIGKNPCSKRKQTTKETQEAFKQKKQSFDANELVQSNQLPLPPQHTNQYSPLQPNNYFNPLSALNSQVQPPLHHHIQLNPLSISSNQGGPVNIISHNNSQSSLNNEQNSNQLQTQPQASQTTHTTHSNNDNSAKFPVPTLDDFLDDFEETQDFPFADTQLPVKSIASHYKVTKYTLNSLLTAQSTFPVTLDLFLSLAIEKNISPQFFINDSLIIPLPTYSCGLFSKDFNKGHFLNHENLQNVINSRIQNFVYQNPNFNNPNFKIIIIFNQFQEGVPERPHENQSHKYVGNVYVLQKFTVLDDQSLSYRNIRYTFNHTYTWVDPKEEWLKNEVFNEMIVKRLQNEVFLQTHQSVLGTHINQSVVERGSIMNMIPYTVDDNYVVTSAASFFVISFMTLKLLRVLTGEDGLNMMSYLLSVKVNSRHNLHLLKLLLDRLNEAREKNSA